MKRVFWSALLIRWPKYWSFSFSISTSNEHSGWISFRTDWLDLLAVRGTSSPTPQFKSINSSELCLPYGQFSHLYMTTEKIIALTIRTFVGKVLSLLFNTLSSCHSFSSKEQVSFDFMAVFTIHRDFGAQEKKTCHYFHFFPFYLP